MIYIELFFAGVLIGFVTGLLVFRKNQRRFTDTEIKGKELLDALKGR